MDKPAATGGAKGGRALGAVLFTIFIDLIGFSIIFPLMPAILRTYIPVGAQGDTLIGRIEAFMQSISPAASTGHDAVALVIFGGVIGSVFSLLQFVSSPVWGRLSDRFGRRRVLLVTTLATSVGYLVWAFSGNFWVFIASRVICGLMAGNISVATAAVADATSTSGRTRGMALLGVAFSLGFMVGPAIGGAASLIHLEGGWSLGIFSFNPFSGCALVSVSLCLLNFLWVYFFFPETLSSENRSIHKVSFNPLGNLHVEGAMVRRVIAVNFAFLLMASGMEFTLTFLALERLDFGPTQNIAIFLFGGLVMTLMQGVFAQRRVIAAFPGEKTIACLGICCSICGMAILGLAQSRTVFFTGLFFKASGMAMVAPTVTSLVSKLTPPDKQGAVMGSFRAMGSLARAMGPVLVAVLYWSAGSMPTYIVSSLILIVPLVMAARLPMSPPAGAAPAPGDPSERKTIK